MNTEELEKTLAELEQEVMDELNESDSESEKSQ